MELRPVVVIAVACILCLPSVMRAQDPRATVPAAVPADTSPTTSLARAAIQKFFPAILSDTADPGTLFIIVSADGQLLNATHGTLEDNDKLKAKYEDFDGKAASMDIKSVPAGALLPRALQVVITTFKP